MKIYIVEVGEYSYTYCVAAYTTEQPARDLADLLDGRVLEPLELDVGVSCDRPPATHYWYVEMKQDGKVVDAYFSAPLEDGAYGGPIGKLKKTGYHLGKTSKRWRLHVYCYANDKEHAVKITNELRSQILAGAKPEGGTYDALLPL